MNAIALEREAELRARYTVPADARKVLVLGESSHWDPNWMHTSEEFYEKRIRAILDAIVDVLEKEPRRVFSIEALFYLRRYWEREPGRRSMIRQLVNRGQLRFAGTNLTTPDTVLPGTEAIIRDYLIGQEWIREHGMHSEPKLAYLPDDFGHSPGLPGVLTSLGFDKVGIDRIDGMNFARLSQHTLTNTPRPDSSAEKLLDEHRTLDFRWRGPDGAEVLCHWNALTYFQGDRFAHLGIVRRMGVAFGMPWRNGKRFSARLDRVVYQLEPLTKTPYMFCPISCDYNGPIEHLVELTEQYNATNFAKTGVYVICAGMEDYLELVDAHRESLPVVELDPNPCWMGFYASRPDIKICSNRIARKLKLAEKLSAWPHNGEGIVADRFPEIQKQIDESWELLTWSNHHDFITGTSPDRVWDEEQGPWLADAESLADDALVKTGSHFLPAKTEGESHEAPQWHFAEGTLQVRNAFYKMEISEAAGGCITLLERADGGTSLISEPANDLIAYRDSGGLWRMGHESRGGQLRPILRASQLPAEIDVNERYGALEVQVMSEFMGFPFVRWLWLHDDSPIIRMRVVGTAAARTTVTCLFPTMIQAGTIRMDVPGAVVDRPRVKLFEPTFWAARNFAHIHGAGDSGGCCTFFGGPSGVSLGENGEFEWVVLRNAPQEKTLKHVPTFRNRARETDPDEHVVDYAVWFNKPGESPGMKPPFLVRQVLGESWLSRLQSPLDSMADSLITTDVPGVLVQAIKRAENGPGWIVRLEADAPLGSTVVLNCPTMDIKNARLCNGREQDLRELPVTGGQIEVPLESTITSVRLTA